MTTSFEINFTTRLVVFFCKTKGCKKFALECASLEIKVNVQY